MWVCVQECRGPGRPAVMGTLELRLQEIMSCLTWVFRIKLGSTAAGAASALTHPASSPPEMDSSHSPLAPRLHLLRLEFPAGCMPTCAAGFRRARLPPPSFHNMCFSWGAVALTLVPLLPEQWCMWRSPLCTEIWKYKWMDFETCKPHHSCGGRPPSHHLLTLGARSPLEPPGPWPLGICFCSHSFCRTSYNWNHKECGIFCLAAFSLNTNRELHCYMSSRWVHVPF